MDIIIAESTYLSSGIPGKEETIADTLNFER